MQLFGKIIFLHLNSSKDSTIQISTFLNASGAHVVNFLQKNIDFVILDKNLYKKVVALPNNINVRSLKCEGSSSVKAFATKWNIPIFDFKTVLGQFMLEKKENTEIDTYSVNEHKWCSYTSTTIHRESDRLRGCGSAQSGTSRTIPHN